jgi:hypothetical protein
MIVSLDARPNYVGALFALLPEGAAVLEQMRSPFPGFLRFKVLMPEYRGIPRECLN